MRRHAQTALLVLLGGMLLKLVVTGAYLRYVRGVHAPLLVLAGVVLLVLAAITLWRDLRAQAQARDDDTIVTGLQLDGLFGSERERASRLAEPIADDVSASHRDRALAAGRAAAAHEGLEETTGAGGGALLRMDAPTAAFDVVSTGSLARVGADSPADPPVGVHRTADPPVGVHRTADPPVGVHRTADPPASVLVALPAPSGSRGEPAGAQPPRVSTRVGWGLLVAALAVVVLSPPALDTFPATRAGALTAGAPDGPLPPGDPVTMSLVDYAAHAVSGGQALVGRQVRLTGFVLAGPRGEPYLARLAVGCCAAGARPVKVGLTGDVPGVLSAGRWVEVVGAYTDRVDRDPVNGAPIPFVSVLSVVEVDPPADPYES